MFHNSFEDLMREVSTERQSDRNDPYDRDIDYMSLGSHLDDNQGFQDYDWDLFNHLLAMDVRAAARPVITDVTEEVFESAEEEIIETANEYLNAASDGYLSERTVHGYPEVLGAASVYVSGYLNDDPHNQKVVSDAADISSSTLAKRQASLRNDK